MRILLCAALLTFSATLAHAADDAAYARIQTSKGDIYIALEAEKAPLTVANFIAYAESGHYDRTIWHRVIDGFVIQGGGYSRSFIERPTKDPVKNESTNGLSNVRGTIAMARNEDCDSARSQFYINLKDNTKLDAKGPEKWQCGYTVFGHVVAGMDVADAIGAVETADGGPFASDVPVEPVYVTRIDKVSEADLPAANEQAE